MNFLAVNDQLTSMTTGCLLSTNVITSLIFSLSWMSFISTTCRFMDWWTVWYKSMKALHPSWYCISSLKGVGLILTRASFSAQTIFKWLSLSICSSFCLCTLLNNFMNFGSTSKVHSSTISWESFLQISMSNFQLINRSKESKSIVILALPRYVNLFLHNFEQVFWLASWHRVEAHKCGLKTCLCQKKRN